MKTKTLTSVIVSLSLLTGLFAQNVESYRELGATPPATDTGPAKKASYTNQSKKNATTARIAFSDKTKPGTLKIDLNAAEIEIKGTNGNEVIVTTTLNKKGAPTTDDDGFRRLDQELAFDLTEKDNIATLGIVGGGDWMTTHAEFEIQVPRNTNLVIKTRLGDDIEIDDIDGDIEVSSRSGHINLENVSGSVIANASSGKVDVEFKRPPTKPVSLTAMNGSIELSLPKNAAANLRMHAMNGAIRTNFPEEAIKLVPHFPGSTIPSVPAVPAAPPASPAGPTDGELFDTIIETRKAQALDYADKGLAAAQKGIAAAIAAIDNTKGLSDEEKELIKRKIQAGADAMPATVRTTTAASSVRSKRLNGELNGGGVEIRLFTVNGPITLKQEK